MDKNIATILLASLIERAGREQAIGIMSSLEQQALQVAYQALVSGSDHLANSVATEESPFSTLTPVNDATPPLQVEVASTESLVTSTAAVEPIVKLVLDAIGRDNPSDPGVLMCLDFGTAMSKAFASVAPDDYLDLELGSAAGRSGYTLPSSVFIGDDGKAYFGFEAIELSQDLVGSGRERLDSIKGWLSLRREGNLDGDAFLLQSALNPIATCKLTQGDLIRVYLAYLTDMANIALGEYQVSEKVVDRYVRRRFARPCWPDAAQAQWADKLMRQCLLRRKFWLTRSVGVGLEASKWPNSKLP